MTGESVGLTVGGGVGRVEPAPAPSSPASELAAEIITRRTAKLAGDIRAFPHRTTYASGIDPCDRRMTYERTHWQEKSLHDPHLQALFEHGNLEESGAVQELAKLGLPVQLQQLQADIQGAAGMGVVLTGKIDGMIQFGGAKVPVEIKSTGEYKWKKMNTLDDIRRDPFAVRWFHQLQVYLYAHNAPEGLILLTDSRGHWKTFVVALDLVEMEAILQKAERVERAVKSGTLPDRIPYSAILCGRCPFAAICLPPVSGDGAEVVASGPLVDLLTRREELKTAIAEAGEYELKEVKEELERLMESRPRALVAGRWEVEWKEQTRPKMVKSETETITVKSLKISELGGGQK